jgi:hypothetical protein
MVIMSMFKFIYWVGVVFIWFIVIIEKFEVWVSIFASCMEYSEFGFAYIDGHLISTKPSCNLSTD